MADKILMLENSVYSILSPEGYASILWKDSSRAEEAAGVMKMTAKDLYNFKVIDKVIKEGEGGAEKNKDLTAENIKKDSIKQEKELSQINLDELVNARYNKYRNMGEYLRKEGE